MAATQYQAPTPRRSETTRGASLWVRGLGWLKGCNRYFDDPSALALACAIEAGDLKLRQFLEQSVEVEYQGLEGITPLIYALIRNKLYAFRALLEAHANPNAKAKDGEGVVSTAALHPDARFLDLALKYEGDPNTRDSMDVPVLSRAVENHRPEHVRILIKYGSDVNLTDSTGTSPLGVAVLMGYKDLVELLLTSGADAYKPNKFDITPSAMAHDEWRSEEIRRCLEDWDSRKRLNG